MNRLLLLYVATGLAAIFALAAQLMSARYTGPVAFGELSVALAVVSMVAPITTFGVTQFWSRVYGAELAHANRWMRTSKCYVVAGCCAAYLILFSIVTFGSQHWINGRIVALISPMLLAYAVTEIASSRMKIEGKYAWLAGWLLLTPALRLCGVVGVAVFTSANASTAIAAAYGFVALLTIAVGSSQVSKLFSGKVAPLGVASRVARLADSVSIATVAKRSWGFGVEVLVYPVYFQCCLLALSIFHPGEAVGLLGVCLGLLAGIYMIPDTLYQKYLIPKLNYWAVHDEVKYHKVLLRAGLALQLIGVAVAVAVYYQAPWVMSTFYGETYADAAKYLNLLALCIPLRFASSAIGIITLISGEAHLRALSLFFAALVAVGVTWVGSGLSGGMAGAIGMLSGELALLLTVVYCARRTLKKIITRSRERVCVMGYYGMQNFGDDLFVRVLGCELPRQCRNLPVVFSSPPIPGVEAKFLLSWVSLRAFAHPIFGRAFRAFSFLMAVITSRYIVLGGGSVINGRFSARNAFLNLLANKGVIELNAVGVSLGPFADDSAYSRAAHFLSAFKLVHVRDARSAVVAGGILPTQDWVQGLDLAGLLNPSMVASTSSDDRFLVYAPCWFESSEMCAEAVNSAVAIGVAEAAAHLGIKVVVCELNAHPRLGDGRLVEQASELIKARGVECMTVRYETAGIEGVLRLIRSAALTVSTRLHGAIASFVLDRKSLMVGYHDKCSDFVNHVGMPGAAYVHVNEVTADRIRAAVVAGLQDQFVSVVSPAEYRAAARSSFRTFVRGV